MASITAMVNKILELMEKGRVSENTELLKSGFMLTEAMFTLTRPDIQLSLLENCVYKVQEIIKELLIALSNDTL